MRGAYWGNGTEKESLIHFKPVTSTLVVCRKEEQNAKENPLTND
jgi:hypothetical protein